jgi:hypothetical protein
VGIVIQRLTFCCRPLCCDSKSRFVSSVLWSALLLPPSALRKFAQINFLDNRADEVRIHQRYGNKGVLRCTLAF